MLKEKKPQVTFACTAESKECNFQCRWQLPTLSAPLCGQSDLLSKSPSLD
jgi:hypothetical protein